MPPKKVVLFDYDGTLCDSIEMICNGISYVLTMSGIKSQEVMRPFFETFCFPAENFYRSFGVTAPLEQIASWYFSVTNHARAQLFSEVHTVLPQLHQQGVILGIISANGEQALRSRLTGENLIHLFSEIHCGIESKPELIRSCALAHSEDLEQCFYVGDIAADMRDAKEAGVQAVGVTHNFPSADILKRNGADIVITKLRELVPIITE